MSQDHSYNALTDEELLLRYRQSDDNKWMGMLLQRYTLLLFGVAMKYLKDKEQANDAVQQIFLKALTHLPAGDIQNFKGWLYIMMRNFCLQELRNKTYKAPEELLIQTAAAEDRTDEYYQKEYTLQQMDAALNDLNEDQRITVSLFYLEKQSYQQIMDRTGFSFMQVKSFIQNGKRNLKQILSRKTGNHS